MVMAKFQIVPASNAPFRSRWGIERVVPGERPVLLDFYGRRAEAEAEVSRLNLHDRKPEQAPVATKRLPRPRDPIQLGKLMVDIATGQVEDTIDDGKNSEAA